MSLTRKAPTAAKRDGEPKRRDLVQALAERDAELAQARRENARLFDELQTKTRDLEESLQQQTATADVLKVISRSAFDLDAVLATLTESAGRLCGANSATVHMREGALMALRAQSGCTHELVAYLKATPIDPASARGGRTHVGRASRTAATIEIPDIDASTDYQLGEAPRLGNFHSIVGVPLLRDGRVDGVFSLARQAKGRFTTRQIELLQSFADQAVIAIENVRLFNEVQAKTRDVEEALEDQIATSGVLQAIGASMADAQPVFERIVENLANLMPHDLIGAWLTPGDGLMRIAAHRAARPFDFDGIFPAPVSQTALAQSSQFEQQFELADVLGARAAPPTMRAIAERHGNFAVLITRMVWNGRLIGTLGVTRAPDATFTARERKLLRTFADQAVIAIENARLFGEVQAKTRDVEEALEQQTASAEILRVISSSPTDARPVFETIVRTARKLCNAERASVHILRDGAYHAIAVEGPRESVHDHRLVHHPILPGRGSITGRVAEERSVVHIHDVKADPEFTYLREDGFEFRRTMLGVPLLRDSQVMGVIVLQRPVVQPFTKTHIDLVTTFADQAVIAIENARLFDEVQAKTHDLEESLRQQTATADVLKVISRSAFDLDAVFDALLAAAVSLVGSRGGTICVREGDRFRYRAVAEGRDSAMWRYLAEHPPTPGRASVAGRILLSGRPEIITDSLLDSELKVPVHALAGSRSVAGVPLLRNDKVEGALMVGRAEAGPFDSRQIELLQTFADQAVIAIENARLFDEVQARTRDLSEALQQQTATAEVLKVISRSAFDLQAVLTTLAESARELCGASFVTLFMRDGEEMRLRAESGCTPEIVAFLRAHPIKAGRDTFTGRVMLSGEAVHLPDVLADPEYDFGDAPRIGNYRTLLGVPLLRDGQVEGVFALARPEPTPFSARQIEMVRAFADQAVIAIENSRLFEEVQARTRELAASLDDLRKAQDRLIQSEKLASLGQLTAGIAHEIKNPLNFISNYSALSRELIGELAEAIKGGAEATARRTI